MADEPGHQSKPLSEWMTPETRKVRRNLLVVCSISLLFVYGGLVPKEIPALGINVQDLERDVILFLFPVVVFYFLASFCIYGFDEFIADRKRRIIDLRQRELTNRQLSDSEPQEILQAYENIDEKLRSWRKITRIKSRYFVVTRTMFDLTFPVIFGILTLVLLVMAYVEEPGAALFGSPGDLKLHF